MEIDFKSGILESQMDSCIETVRQVVGGNSKHVWTLDCNGTPSSMLADFMRDDKKSKIVCKAETQVELGHPSLPSALLILLGSPTLVRNKRITAVRNDIGQLRRGSHSFAQIVLVGGSELRPEHLPRMRAAASAVGQLDGCMARMFEEKIWIRVSSKTVQKGFSFMILGEHLLKKICEAAPSVRSAEVIFLVDMPEQIEEIAKLAKALGAKRRKEVLEEAKRRTGRDYECENPYDCDLCPDKPDCDVLKDVAREVNERKLKGAASAEGGD